MNTGLCDKFSVGHYPMLLWGPPAKFAAGRWDPKQENSEILSIDDGRTAKRLLSWINKRIGRCRRGTAELLVNFDELWPKDLYSISSEQVNISHERDILKSYWICGKEVPRGYWIFCHGSKNETRGFSRGLWVLLHSLSVRAGDGEIHFAFTSICDFIQNFFLCDECRRHFGAMCSSVSVPFNSTCNLALWLWSAHNKVNERLMKEERDLGTGDPKFPKIIWPTKQLCPSCYLSQSSKSCGTVKFDRDFDKVFNFLVRYYGKTLVSSSEDENRIKIKRDESIDDDATSTTHPLTVPLGAALGIALASLHVWGIGLLLEDTTKES